MKNCLFFSCLVLSLAANEQFAQEPKGTWPQWRGPTRDGRFAGPAWPERLQGDSLKLLWRVPLGPSYSGPIVAADRVFVTQTRDKKEEIVQALDRKTGKELWRAQWEGSITVPAYARGNGEWIRSTPAYDGDSLFVAGIRDVLVCFDAATGKERWRVDFVDRYQTPLPPFGCACSPLVDDQAVYFQGGASLVKLDKKTGKTLWRVLPHKSSANDGTAVSSPVLVNLAGLRQLVVQHPKLLAGVDLDTGKVLWSGAVPAFRNTNIVTPTIFQDSVLSSAFGGRTILFRVTHENQQWQAEQAWDYKEQGYMSTPVVIGEHAYMLLRNQRFSCIDLKTGMECWKSGQRFGRYWSMVTQGDRIQGDRILALDQDGTLLLVRANPKKFELLDSRKISEEESWAHLAVAGQQLFVRELNALAVYTAAGSRSGE